MDWQEWFEVWGPLRGQYVQVNDHKQGLMTLGTTNEEMYQVFKARMIEELCVSNPDCRVMGILVDKPSEERPHD